MKRTQRRVKTLTNVNRWIKKLGTRVAQLAGPAATPSALTNASARKDSAPLALLAQVRIGFQEITFWQTKIRNEKLNKN